MKRTTLFWASMLIGPLILASYWRGVNAVDDPLVYWGDVPASMQSFIVPWMFVAVKNDIEWRAAGSKAVADEQEILYHGDAIVQLVTLFEGHIELLEASDHRNEQGHRKNTDQRRALRERPHFGGERPNGHFARFGKRQPFTRHHQHEGGKG
jgi:hypothetical protein